jgi:iron complex outermembrane recepter protein
MGRISMIKLSARTLFNLGVAAAALSAMPAFAQEAAPAAEAAEAANDLDIVVTARRRDENLLDVPIAITAFSGETLLRQGAIDITDLSQTTPNVTLETSRGTNSTLTAFIRGVGQQDPVAGFEAGVGLYLDDVYLNRPQAAVLDIYDVERIEVLRGPQGTLYGRNTIGGAVKYVTRRLSDSPELRLRAVYGSYDQADGVVSGSVPVGDGTLRLGGAFARLSRGGFGRNLTTGQENYNKDVWAGRLTGEVHTTGFFARLSADYTKDESNPRGGHRLITALNNPALTPLDDVYDSRGALVAPKQDVEAKGISLFMEGSPSDWLTLRSITGYRKDDSSTPIDFDALPAVDVDVPAFYNNRQFSQELQALIDVGPLNLLVGAYYLDASARTAFDVRLPGTVTALTFGRVLTDTTAIFADGTFDITDQLSISAGARYTWDRRDSTVVRNVFLGPSPLFGGTTNPIVQQTNFRGQADFSRFTPRASISFKPTPDHNIYASYAKGFKGGGFDPRGVGTAAPDRNGNGVGEYSEIYDFLSFDPETVDSYELGWKGRLFDDAFTFALAAFRADYKDVQIPGSVGQVVNGVQTFVGITTNAGKARIQGVEFEGNLVARDAFTASDRLSLSVTAGYIDAEYKRFIDARGIDVADRRGFQNTPKWTVSETLAYDVPVGPGQLNASATLSYRSRTQQFELRSPLDQPKYALLDANLVYTFGENDRYSIGLHARNITDKQYIVSGYNFLRQNPDTGAFILANGQPGLSSTLGATGVLTAYYGNPRQVFGSLNIRF